MSLCLKAKKGWKDDCNVKMKLKMSRFRSPGQVTALLDCFVPLLFHEMYSWLPYSGFASDL